MSRVRSSKRYGAGQLRWPLYGLPRRGFAGIRLAMRIMIVLACIFASAWGVAEHDTTQQRDTSVNDMPLGVDDAGATTPIWKDEAAKEAFRTIGFDFLSFHLYPATSQEDLRALDKWAEEARVTYLLNQECADRRPGAPDVYPRAGTFY